MALINLNPSAIASTIGATAAGRISQGIAQRMSPKLVQDTQRVLKVGSLLGNALGLRTGTGAIDNLLALGSQEDIAQPLLGGLSFRQARAIHDQVKATRIARKNLFFIRVIDANPPAGTYAARPAGQGAAGGLFSSKIGAAMGEITKGITGGVKSIAGAANSALASMGINGGVGTSDSIASMALSTFDLLAVDVSYGPSLNSDHVQVGSGFIDRPTGRNPTELSITTMDDEAGTIKRWFNGKLDQVALPDGTFGLPWEYLLNIEIVHAIPSEKVEGAEFAYSHTMRLRPQSLQLDLSRRDQALSEFTLTFSQFDNFMGL